MSLILHLFILHGRIKENTSPKTYEIEITMGGTIYASSPPSKKKPERRKRVDVKENTDTPKIPASKKKKMGRPAKANTKKTTPHTKNRDIVVEKKKKITLQKDRSAEKRYLKTAPSIKPPQPSMSPVRVLKKESVKDGTRPPDNPRHVSTKRSTPPLPQSSGSKAANQPGATVQRQGLKNYLSRIRQIIEAHKYYPYNARIFGREGKVGLSFVISEKGTIHEVSTVKPCRYGDLNRAALRTLRASSPLPPPPKGLSPPLRVNLTLVFQLEK